MTELRVYYESIEFAEHDDLVEKLVGREAHSSGTFLPTGERDLQFTVDDAEAGAIADRLRGHGFKVMLDTDRA